MGVPKFFRFISERYPCISELLKKDIHECDFDNLYLDMNGIIHVCSHPDDNNVHFRITEEQIFRDVFHYISYLFQLIGPKKVFFMAIDGVAPRAKMNQQRSRRFQSAREAKEAVTKALEKGEKLPKEKNFDTNCITPGTEFMTRLQQQLKFFVKNKISTDRAWASCRVILSGHETPGEGEHKIMDYIRYLRSQPGHDPNTRHCLYGMDADLIMLGLCTHEPNFSILREEVIFKKDVARRPSPDESNFYLLHLSLLKDYIEQEFSPLKSSLKNFTFDIDKIIDDWILMSFLVGNDFIPNLPNLVINKNALPQLYDIYKKVLPTMDGYINENGVLNLDRFEFYMRHLSELDKNQFQEIYEDTKYFEGKTGRRINKNLETFGCGETSETPDKKVSGFKSDLLDLISSTNDLVLNNEDNLFCWNSDDEKKDDDSSDDMFDTEFMLHKRDYYMSKLDYANVTEDVLKSQAECYVRAIQWILHYYYQGCTSWSWFYPHHYAPYLSDVKNFKDMKINFDLGKPFKPYEQLLAVLPVASKDLLPEAFHPLMTSEKSPIVHYYPEDFETDLNGKLNQWEAVVLLPFIDEYELLSAISPCYKNLTNDEQERNIHGPMLVYEYTSENLGNVFAPSYFPPIIECHAKEIPVWIQDIVVPAEKVVRGALSNKYKDFFFPGVPRLINIQFICEFIKARVKIFDLPSRNDNAILHIYKNKKTPVLSKVAEELLGKIVWVGWPYIMQSKVIAVADDQWTYKYVPTVERNSLEDDIVDSISRIEDKAQFAQERRVINDHHMQRLGVDLGDVDIVVRTKPIKGYKHILGNDGKLIYEVEWCQNTVPYPLQTVLKNINVAPITAHKQHHTVNEAFPRGERVFIVAGPYYGCMAEITDTDEVKKSGRIKVMMSMESEPVIDIPPNLSTDFYMPARIAAGKCGISPLLFSRITSFLYVTPKEKAENNKRTYNINIGLGMKNQKMNEALVGFTFRDNKTWFYSDRCVEEVCNYIFQFENMFTKLQKFSEDDNISGAELFADEEYTLNDVVQWLKHRPYLKYPTRSCFGTGLDIDELQNICRAVDSQLPELEKNKKSIGIKVKPHVLFKEDLRKGNIPPDMSCTEFHLYDRVVNVSSNSSVPLGHKGTIVAIIPKGKENSVKLTETMHGEPIYQVLFDQPFHSASKICEIEENRFYMMYGFNLLNITVGRTKHCKVNNKVVQPTLPQGQFNNVNKFLNNNSHNSAFAPYSSPTKGINANIKKPLDEKPLIDLQHDSIPTNRHNNIKPPPLQSYNMSNVKILKPEVQMPPKPVPILPPFLPMPIQPNVVHPPRPPPNMMAPTMVMPFSMIPPMPTFIPQGFNPPEKLAPVQIRPPPPSLIPLQPDRSTEVLKSLLKINEGLKNAQPKAPPPANQIGALFGSPNVDRTPPNKTQLPFPAKLIDSKDAQPVKILQRNPNPPVNFAVPPFIPLQVTKKVVNSSESDKLPLNNNSAPTTATSMTNTFVNMNNVPERQSQPTNFEPLNPNPIQPQRQKSQRSRLAANFKNPKK